MFILWQATTVPERVGAEPIRAGDPRHRAATVARGTSPCPTRATPTSRVRTTAPDLPVVFDFDPGSLVLTAYGRINGGTAYGDAALADRYRRLFHSI